MKNYHVLVRNIKGTSKDKPPKGFDLWIDFWENEKQASGRFCHAESCKNLGLVIHGSHVFPISSYRLNKPHIVPLCAACNQRDDEFMVRDELVPIPNEI